MVMALSHITQKPAKGSGLDGLQLLLHPVDVCRELEFGFILEMDVVGGIDALQVEMILDPLTQIGIGLGIDLGQKIQAGPDIKAVAILHDLVAAPTWSGGLFQDGNVTAPVGQACSDGNAAHARADHKYRGHRGASFIIRSSTNPAPMSTMGTPVPGWVLAPQK